MILILQTLNWPPQMHYKQNTRIFLSEDAGFMLFNRGEKN